MSFDLAIRSIAFSAKFHKADWTNLRFIVPHPLSMTDLTNPTLIKFKGILFFFIGLISSALLIFEHPSARTALLLVLVIWGFCRAYYFAFYVIEHYVDPSFKFSGLGAFVRYMMRRRTGD
jgi:hypothetical protein